MDEFGIIWRVLFGMLLGGVIGFEREYRKKPAGLRTHMLICGAVTLLTTLSFAAVDTLSDQRDVLTVDPIRIIQAIVLGVSFIGAGVIVQGRNDVYNLTSSAGVLFTAAIGISVGLDKFITAAVLTLTVLLVIHMLGTLEKKHF